MLNTPTEQKLHAMRLGTMAETWLEQAKSAQHTALSFDDRFGMIVDAEYLHRDNQRLARLLRDARLRIADANLEDVRAAAERGLDKSLISQLQSERWLVEHSNVLITGPTGVGKTYLACALGQLACRRGYRTLYRRLPRLLDELTLARADGTYTRLLDKLAKTRLLIIDDWGLAPLKDNHRRDVLEILEDRYGKTSLSLPASCPPPNGTATSANPPSPMLSSTGSSTAPTSASSKAHPDGRNPPLRSKPKQQPCVATLRSRWPVPSDHDAAKRLITMREIGMYLAERKEEQSSQDGGFVVKGPRYVHETFEGGAEVQAAFRH